jgi:hypothetical protein
VDTFPVPQGFSVVKIVPPPLLSPCLLLSSLLLAHQCPVTHLLWKTPEHPFSPSCPSLPPFPALDQLPSLSVASSSKPPAHSLLTWAPEESR